MAHHPLTKVTEVTTPLATDIWQKLTQTTRLLLDKVFI
jgi:hypothetical protein